MTATSSDPTALAAPARERLGRVGVWLGTIGTSSATAEREAIAELEQLGYPALWIGEAPINKEAFAHAGILLAASERIVVATGIANIWVRDAAASVLGADALGEAYPGRFVLGLGVSHAPLARVRGHDYAKPLAAMRAYLDAIDTVAYRPPAPAPPVPRVLAALRPKMLQLARDRSAGAHPYLVPVEHTARARTLLGPEPLLAPEQAVVLERHPAKARELGRRHLSYYFGLPNYVDNLRALGFGDVDFADGGSDRLVDAIVAWGDVDAVVRRVREHHDAGADHVAIQPLGGSLASDLAQLRELAPALLTSS